MKLSRLLVLTMLYCVIGSALGSAIASAKSKRSIHPFSLHPTLCTLTSEESFGLIKSVQDSIKDLTSNRIAEIKEIHGHYDCSRIPSSLNGQNFNCTQLIAEFQTSTSCLVQSVITFRKNKNDTRYEELKRDVERQESAYKIKMNNLERRLNQELKNQLDLVNTEMQEKIEKLVVENAKIRKRLKTLTLESIIDKIHFQDLVGAVNLYKELGQENQLPEIVQRAYNKTSTNAEKILQFSRELSQMRELAIAYETLFEQMKLNHHLASPDTLILSFYVKEFMEMTNYPHVAALTRSRISQMNMELLQSTRSIVDAWGERVRNQDYSSVITFAKQSLRAGHLVQEKISDIVSIAYAYNVRNFKSIIKFASNLPLDQQIALAFKALFENMAQCGHKDTAEFVMLAYKVKMYLDTTPDKQSLKTSFENLKESFPNTIKNLLWKNNKCSIRNTLFSEYLTLSFNRNYRKSGILSHAFTYRKSWSHVPSRLSYFKLIPYKYGNDEVCFALKNNGYLTTDGRYDNDRRHVIYNSNMDDNQGKNYCYWKITPRNGASSFTIRRWGFNEYLYAATDRFAFNDERRRVFTWIPGNEINNGYWEINC